jgi:hypothetical protein
VLASDPLRKVEKNAVSPQDRILQNRIICRFLSHVVARLLVTNLVSLRTVTNREVGMKNRASRPWMGGVSIDRSF